MIVKKSLKIIKG